MDNLNLQMSTIIYYIAIRLSDIIAQVLNSIARWLGLRALAGAVNRTLVLLLMDAKPFVLVKNEAWSAWQLCLLSVHAEVIVFTARVVISVETVARTSRLAFPLHAIQFESRIEADSARTGVNGRRHTTVAVENAAVATRQNLPWNDCSISLNTSLTIALLTWTLSPCLQ